MDAERTPVIVGVGQINDRPADPAAGLDSAGLMIAALRLAEEDAGVPLLAHADSLGIVPQVSFRRTNPLMEKLCEAIGADPRFKSEGTYPGGHTPILRLNEAANLIGSGEAKICLVTGGEALRTSAQQKAIAKGTSVSEQNAMRGRAPKADRVPEYRELYNFLAPIDIYPLYENALRPKYGQTLEEGQRESGEIWSRFSQVAAENESAWIRSPATAEEIITPSAGNRPLAFPYTKLMVANSSVNQGAAFIVMSLAEAERRGIAKSKFIYVGLGAGADECEDFLLRDRYDGSTSLETVLTTTLDWNGMTSADLDWVELYSCFPCVPKMARRAIGWPLEKAATVFGGLTFGGGPIANYMGHAVAEMVHRLRQGGKNGLLFANGGLASQNHAIVVSNQPMAGATFPQRFDIQAEVDALRPAAPALDKLYVGPATIETYTVFHDRAGQPTGGSILARTPNGDRVVARVLPDDEASIAFLTDGKAEPVGTQGEIVADGELRTWRLVTA